MGQMARLMGRDGLRGLAGEYSGKFGSSVLAGKMSGRASNYFLGAGVSTAQKAFRMGVPGALAGYAGYKAVRDPDSTTGKIARFGLAAAVVGGAVYAGSKRGFGNLFRAAEKNGTYTMGKGLSSVHPGADLRATYSYKSGAAYQRTRGGASSFYNSYGSSSSHTVGSGGQTINVSYKPAASSTMAREAAVSSGSVANSVVRSGHAAKIYDMPLASRETRAAARLVEEQANYRLKYGSLGAFHNIEPPPNFGAAGRNRSMLASYPGYANPMSGGASSFGGHHIPSSFTRQRSRNGRFANIRGLYSKRSNFRLGN